jgi:tRNA(His) 5'-end guanylyltransferase
LRALKPIQEQELLQEQANKEKLLLEERAVNQKIEPTLVKIGVVEDRVKKLEELIAYLEEEDDHFKTQTEEHILPEVGRLVS